MTPRMSEGVKPIYMCDQCNKIYTARSSLYSHKKSKHHGNIGALHPPTIIMNTADGEERDSVEKTIEQEEVDLVDATEDIEILDAVSTTKEYEFPSASTVAYIMSGRVMKAHKVVLSASINFLENC